MKNLLIVLVMLLSSNSYSQVQMTWLDTNDEPTATKFFNQEMRIWTTGNDPLTGTPSTLYVNAVNNDSGHSLTDKYEVILVQQEEGWTSFTCKDPEFGTIVYISLDAKGDCIIFVYADFTTLVIKGSGLNY